MNQQLLYLNQLKQMTEIYQFMAKLCWLKAITDKLAGEHGCSTAGCAGCTGVVREESNNKTVDPQAQVGEKRTSGSEKLATNLHLRKTTCKLLSHLEKPEVSTIVASAVIKGRMYDFNSGRFLSVDPFIQGTTSQAINPYSYIQNNPLSGTDPTGYAAEHLLYSHLESKGIDTEELKATQAEVATEIVLAVDTASDFVNPLKGASKQVLKTVLKETKKLFSKKGGKTAVKNGKENVPTKTNAKNGDVSDIKSEAKKDLPTQRAATRQAKRDAGIPTSQQAKKQTSPRTKGNEPLGREQEFDSPKSGGGTEKRAVIISRDKKGKHAGVPTAEAGKVKMQGGVKKRTRSGKLSLKPEGKKRVKFKCKKKDGGDC